MGHGEKTLRFPEWAIGCLVPPFPKDRNPAWVGTGWEEVPGSVLNKVGSRCHELAGNGSRPGQDMCSPARLASLTHLTSLSEGEKQIIQDSFWRRKWQPTPVFLPGK